MSAGALTVATVAPEASPRPGRAVSGLALRQIRRSGLVTAVLAAGMTALVVSTYEQVMADPAAVRGLQALAGNAAIRTLFGEPSGLDTAGGFTVWRIGTVTAVLLAAWSILATTRITRGEEDAGRWDVLLAGRVPLREAVTRHLAVAMIVPVAAGLAIGAVLLAAGTPLAGTAVHSVGTAALGLFFVAAAALAAQVFPARSLATGAAFALLGVGLLARMVGDGVTELGWLRWLSPFGLLALGGPYVHDRALPVAVLIAVTAAVTVAARLAAGHREVRGALVRSRTGRAARLGLLGSVEAFAVRRVLRPLTGWTLGVGAYYLLIGLTAVSVTAFLADNAGLADQAEQAGFASLRSIAGFTATLFAVLAMPAGVFAATRLGAFVAAENDRRLTSLMAQPISRARLIGAETIATAAAATMLVTAAGLAVWAGAATTGGYLPLLAALRGAWNVLPIGLLSLGAAVLAAGWAPRWTGIIGALPSVGGFLLLVIADSIAAPRWLHAISPFDHLAPVPLTTVNWTPTTVMTAAALLLITAGAAGYQRRDLAA
ncbi:hypothetical protein Ade02nite_35040 [Paractinoplanes deccanensis]|uniref:Polyketide antibiotic transporter n=1 Tax=Paractinoplanes deccanensis TaxID=113561 RepID=A0ABQ3Y4D9_9ACTN|nr:hypothetical protein [Actinoplanes deccanensis]GID74863.1 hypothetical protein Ade02nite_35040 [Actinoplanes deccanensis]